MSDAVGATARQLSRSLELLMWHAGESIYARRGSAPEACDFCFGNPHDMPMPEVHEALQRWAVPHHPNWFAYKFSEPRAMEVVARSLRDRLGIPFEAADVAMTNGAFGAIAAALRAVVDPGDEVVYLSPPWFFYEPMILSLGARPVRVDFEPPRFELPVSSIEAAITERTRAIIVNSPHNPSGRIFTPAELAALGEALRSGSRRIGRTVYLLSDEAYSRILFDGSAFHTPVAHYEHSMLLYTYGKTLLIPGQRMGFIALPPGMAGREELRRGLMVSQLVTAYAFPNAIMQYAVEDLEALTIDVAALQRRRDRMVPALREMGYEVIMPEGTFYVLVRSPLPDEVSFTDRLAQEDVFVLPGRVFEMPGWFRISLTASDEMVERALPVFSRAVDIRTAGVTHG